MLALTNSPLLVDARSAKLIDAKHQGDVPSGGTRRLKGAFCIAVDCIRPDLNQPRKNLETAAQRELTASVQEQRPPPLVSDWPLPEPRNWTKQVNSPQTEAELAAIRRSAERGSLLGSEAWVQATAQALGLTSTLRPRGRPKFEPEE